ncbi:hypothetical protein ACHAP5_009281 [Fusarium lateritium]
MYRIQRRMMQWQFKFMNLDKGEHTSERDRQDLKMVVVTADKLVSLLRKPEWVEFKINPTDMHAAKQKSSENCPLIALPQEVLDRIFNALVDNGDGDALVCLALTNSYFFRRLCTDMQKMMVGEAGKWAGDRVIFTSDLARGIEENIGTDEEEAEWYAKRYNSLAEIKTTEIKSVISIHLRLPKTAPKIFNIPGESVSDAKEIMRKKRDNKSLVLLDSLLLMLQQAPDLTFEQKQPILRNLVTKQYVRARGCIGTSNRQASLGEALMAFTYFVGDSAWKPNTHRWIGHRFDISPAVSIEGNEEWVDVTDAAADGIKYSETSIPVWRKSLDNFLVVALPTAFTARMKAKEEEEAARLRAAAGEDDDDSSSGSILLIQQN